MNKNSIKTLEQYIELNIKDQEQIPNEENIRASANIFKLLIKDINEEEVAEAIKNLEKRYYITMDSGVTIKNKDTYKKWYHASKADRDSGYWERYHRYLESDKRMPHLVIDKIDEAADQIMDNLADPQSQGSFNRKGLVIGAVQSGKTSNYIALMNKAADSGYKVIILLTGTIEKLRRQTQARVDEGFSGSDSKAQIMQKKTVVVGVGKYNELPVTALTRTDGDFNVQEAIKIDGQKGPVVFVLKKNKSILTKLEQWLRLHNLNRSTNKIEEPLLLIDDEADNASVNTAHEDKKDPTMINQKIRDIINLFSKSSYVGFTATPFANIFIDPQIEDKNGDDLFPRDFISLLEQPSNYVGPNDMYPEEGKYHFMIRNNDDVEAILPLKHKKEETISRLPNSLKDAIMVFFIANAIRDIRGDIKEHRSMLVHISRFISVQDNVKIHVDAFVNDIKRQIKNYINFPENSEVVKRLKYLYEIEFEYKEVSDCEESKVTETWEQVQEVLLKAVMPIQVKVVNSGNATKEMDYDEYPDGLRIIAIGGLSLARGLTLEGLMTSYFYRNTRMYDTLMQMGRWFGFRDGYVDLCRLWTSTDSADWYEHIANATEELRWEIKKMAANNKKPIEFGLKVLSAEDTPLIITAKNKMRSATTIKLRRSLNGQMVETAILPKEMGKNDTNFQIIDEWLEKNKGYAIDDLSSLSLAKPTLKNIPKDEIVNLITLLDYPYTNDLGSVIESIKKHNLEVFDQWDVVIASKDKSEDNEFKYGPFMVNPINLSFDFWGTQSDIRLSGSKKRMGSTQYARGGLTNKEYSIIEPKVLEQRRSAGKTKSGKPKSASQNMYFNTGISRNPLLVIYPVILKQSTDAMKEDINKFAENIDRPITGISIGIPDIENIENITYEYEMNMVMQYEKMGIYFEDIGQEEDDEDNEELME